MKLFQQFLGYLSAFSLIFILLITSIEAVTYWTPGYYEKEFNKYHVTEQIGITTTDLLSVTEEMMLYLRGQRPDLDITTTINGQARSFFNEREIAHMEDVRELFIRALIFRNIAFALILFILIFLFITKANLQTLLPKAFCISSSGLLLITIILGGIISTNFTRYFTVFHELFFNNDLWLLDPRTDLLINMVPEPFFIDTALQIVIYFVISMIVLFTFCCFFLRRQKK